jgi:predicted signal transduction protein with EAL and GGDEF domain
VALTVLPAFIYMCIERQELTLVTIGINVALVLGVLLRVLFNTFSYFRNQVLSATLLASQHAELQRLNEENRRLALTDSLTGLPNRRQFHADLDRLTAQDGRAPLPSACSISTVSSRSTIPMAIRSATACSPRLPPACAR